MSLPIVKIYEIETTVFEAICRSKITSPSWISGFCQLGDITVIELIPTGCTDNALGSVGSGIMLPFASLITELLKILLVRNCDPGAPVLVNGLERKVLG